jgi:predicted RNase H-like HicB family nuclease
MDRIVYQIEESQVGKSYMAFCPELVVTGFGNTSEEARESLRREIAAYLEDCEEMGIVDEVLIEAGFYDNDEVWMSSLVIPPKEPKITIL